MRPRPEITIRDTPVTPQPEIAATALEVPPGDTQAGDRDHWSDDVAAPVHNVEDGAFDGCCLLALHGLAELRGGAEVLGSRHERRREIANEDKPQCKLHGDVYPIDFIGAMKSAGGCRGGHWGAPPEGECGSHTVFLSWTRLLGASVSSRRLRLDRNSVKLAGADRDGKQHYLSAHERVGRPGACWRGPVPNWQIGRNGKNRARISIEEPGVASCRQARDNGMASTSRLNPYQCDQCGTTNIVAAPLLYEQGTRSYSGPFHSGTSQSYSAQAAAPPDPRGYGRPLLLWGIPICFTFFLGLRRPWRDFGTSAFHCNVGKHRRRFAASRRGVHWRNAPAFPQHRPV